MDNIYKARRDIIHVCKRIYDRGYVASNDGNVSVRLSENRVLITPTGRSKGFLTESDLIIVDMEGKVVSGKARPSSESKIHTVLYKVRPDVKGVVHAHPVTATGFAVAGIALMHCVLPEIVLTVGQVPIAEYGTPSTMELPEAVIKLIHEHDAFLLENHGALTLGPDVISAYHKMESVEHFAQISLVARMLGGERVLSETRVKQLIELRRNMGIAGRNPLEVFGSEVCESPADGKQCTLSGVCATANGEMERLTEMITKKVMAELKT
jgi:L-fuculose-phosphate aldolase